MAWSGGGAQALVKGLRHAMTVTSPNNTCVAMASALGVPTRAYLMSTLGIPLPALPAARGAVPARPPCCDTRPCCGRGEGERRLAGPGLGGAAANAVLAKAVGRPPLLRHAALSIATVGDGWEWARKWPVLRGCPDACPRPRLMLILLSITLIIVGRRAGDPSAPSGLTRPVRGRRPR